MISQKQINEWIPETFEIFKRVMDLPDMQEPKIYIGSRTTYEKARAAALEYTGCTRVNKKSSDDTVMEYIGGDKGQAILIQQRFCPKEKVDFQCCLWHELGHFLSEYMDGYSKYTKEKLSDDEFVENIGYDAISEFIADAVSNYVYEKNGGVYYNKGTYWCYRVPELLDMVFNKHPKMVSGYFLGVYFADILTDGSYKMFEEDTRSRKIYNGDGSFIDPTYLSEIEEKYVNDMMLLKECYEYQLGQKPFWRVKANVLRAIGELVIDLVKIKNDVKGTEI